MTYEFSARRAGDGSCEVKGIFWYGQPVTPFYALSKSQEEFEELAKREDQRIQDRQGAVKDAVIKFLTSKHGARALKETAVVQNDFPIINNAGSKHKRYYQIRAMERTSRPTQDGNRIKIEPICVEVYGRLKETEHLEDMLDCVTLDKILGPIFQKYAIK